MLLSAGAASAEGELNIFNWGNYTSPELIKKFEEKYKVKVTVTDYDSNDTALAKVEAGGHGFDIVVPSANYVPIWINEGLLLETRPDQMENFKNVDEAWMDVDWDPGRKFTVPWQWGTTGVVREHERLQRRHQHLRHLPRSAARTEGKINVVPEMTDVMSIAIHVYGRQALHRRHRSAEEGARQAAGGQAELAGAWTMARSRRFAKDDMSGRRQLERLDLPHAACRTPTSSTAIRRKAIRSGWIRWPC